jgi:hypothetical protein
MFKSKISRVFCFFKFRFRSLRFTSLETEPTTSIDRLRALVLFPSIPVEPEATGSNLTFNNELMDWIIRSEVKKAGETVEDIGRECA